MSCADCGRPYGDEHGFPDLEITEYAWRTICQSGEEHLCPSCICGRLHKTGITSYGAFMSGPIRSVDQPTMEALRWIENIRETLEAHGIFK